ATINQVLYCAFVAHWLWIVHQAEMSPFYVMGTLVVSFGFNLGYVNLRLMGVFSAVLILSSAWCCWATEAPLSSKFMLLTGVCTSQIIGMSFAYTKSVIMANLEAAEVANIKLKNQIMEKELEAAEAVQRNLLSHSKNARPTGV